MRLLFNLQAVFCLDLGGRSVSQVMLINSRVDEIIATKVLPPHNSGF
jgi:hypothetical protein